MTKLYSIFTLVLLVLTIGCGFSIYYGGEAFKGAIKGHLVLAILTLISLLLLVISIFKQ